MEFRDYIERCFVILAILAWAAMMVTGLLWIAASV